MAKCRCALLIILSTLCLSGPLPAQEPDAPPAGDPEFADRRPRSMEEQLQGAQQRMQQQYGDAQQRQVEEMGRLSLRMEAQYRALAERMEQQRAQFRARVAQQWAAVEESSEKTWVDYGEKTDARSKVDFEKGEVEIEVLVPLARGQAPGKLSPAEEQPLRALAREKLRAQTHRMLAQAEPQAPPPPPQREESPSPATRAEPAAPVMAGQLRDAAGGAVTERGADKFVDEQLAPKMVIDPSPVVGADGKARIKVKVRVAMVPGHLKVRADRYTAQVNAQARKLAVDPSLILAVMQTESSFNPMARSNAGAFGLMQLIPRAAAHEAYRHLYKTDKLVTPEYLYDPDHNIELGAGYLQLLQTAYFGKVRSEASRQVLSIASYNCGPTRVRKTVVAGRDLDAMTPAQVLELVRRLTPEETRNYVARVRERMALYR